MQFYVARLAVLFVVLIGFSSTSYVSAQYGEIAVVTKNHRQRGVLLLNFFQESYRAAVGTMHVKVTSVNGPSQSDRHLVIAFQIKTGSKEQSVLYRRPLVLPEGATSISAEIPNFLADRDYSYGRALVYEDGRDISDQEQAGNNPVKGVFSRIFAGNSNRTNRSGNTIIATSETRADADNNLNNLLDVPSTNAALPALFVANNFPLLKSSDMSKRAREIAKASADWRYYYGSDAFVVTALGLEELLATRPDVADGLKTFVMSGGSVIIKGSTIEHAKSVTEQWLDDQRSTPMAKLWVAWDIPAEILVNQSQVEYSVGMGNQPSPRFGPTPVAVPEKSKPESTATNYEHRQYYLGNIVACMDTSLPAGTGPAHKLMAEQDGNWFWRNLITSVGKPPVWVFAVLVAVLSTLIGPGLLYVTGRLKRRSMLILLVPVVSLLATSIIVAYSILHEGFGTSIRITGVMAVDAKTGNGFAWSRQNYFSGIPPRDGLHFSAATYVRPVIEEDENYRYPSNPFTLVSTYVDLTDDSQIWRNWLRARQQQQMLVGHKIKTQVPIACKPSADFKSAALKNLTAATLPFVVVRGDGDYYYLAEELSPGEERSVQADDLQSARVLVSRARSSLQPDVPPELAIASNSLMNFAVSRRSRWGSVVSKSDAEMINNAYHQFLSDQLTMPNRSFVTAINDTANIEVPLKGNIVESTILVVGSAAW